MYGPDIRRIRQNDCRDKAGRKLTDKEERKSNEILSGNHEIDSNYPDDLIY